MVSLAAATASLWRRLSSLEYPDVVLDLTTTASISGNSTEAKSLSPVDDLATEFL
jgi:hypothetical protein